MSASYVPFLLMLALSLVLLAIHAPTEARVRRADDELRARQVPIQLSDALAAKTE